MGFSDYMQKSNENNLKRRNTYRRLFRWGSYEKPGFIESKLSKKKYSKLFKTKLETATQKRLFKNALLIVFFLLLTFAIAVLISYFE